MQPSETSLFKEQTGRAHTREAIEAEGKVHSASSRLLQELSGQLEAQASALAATANKIKAVLDGLPANSILNRRDVPGLIVRDYKKDVVPWIVEFISWKVGAAFASTFRVFQKDISLAEIIRKDQLRIESEINNLVGRAVRGW